MSKYKFQISNVNNMSPRRNGFEGVAVKEKAPLFENADLITAHAEIVRVLNQKRIKETAFYDANSRIHSHTAIDADVRRIKEMQDQNMAKQTNQDRRRKAISDLLEGLIYLGITEGKWLGENVESFPTALFDDYVNGVDQIIDFHYPETDSHAYLGLAIDVTTGNPGTVYEKFEKIKSKIDAGTLATIQYFSRANFHGVVKNVPQAVVGIEPNRVEQLALDWQLDRESLGQSPIKRLLLMQMRLQMETFASYAEWKGKPELTKIFLQDERRLKAILDNTPIGKDDMVDLSNDDVFHSIDQALSLFRVPLKSV